MIKKKLIIYAFILIVLAVSVCAVTFTDYSLQPSSTSTDFVYWYLDADNLTLFYNYTDGRLNILQDWFGTIWYDGVANVSLPPSIARYTFDYDAGNGTSTFNENNTVVDRGIIQRNYDGIRNNLSMEGIIAYFGFEDNNGTHTYDWANGTLANLTGVELATGHKGQAYNFTSGDDRGIVMPDSNALRMVGGGTISAWIMPNPYGESEGGAIVSKSLDTGSGEYGYTFNVWDAYSIQFDMTPAGGLSRDTISSINAITPGVWQHVAVTFNNTEKHLYVNGVDVTYLGGDSEGSPWNTADEVSIGNTHATMYNQPFDGLIDEVYFFNRTITSSELAVLSSVSCNKGYCYDFDGEDSRIVIPITATDLWMIHGGTITAWIKPLSVGENNAGRIVDKAQNAAAGNGYSFSLVTTNRLQFQVDGGTYTISSNNAITLDEWNFVVVTFDDNGRHLYVNGVDVTSSGGSETGLPPDVVDDVCIGNRASGWEYTFNGTIDDVRFFNTSLSEEQIRFVYLDMINVSNLAMGDYYMTLNVSLLDSVVNLTSPNTTLRDGTFNITIFEEDTGSSLSGTNATIALRLGDITTDYWTDTGNKTITGLAGGLWTLTVGATGFSYRTYEATLSGYETVDVVAYLVPNSSATVTFNVQNEDNGESIEDAYATMYRNIGEGFEVVESRYTDITGRVLFSYIPNGEYRFLFTKSGFEELLFTLNPIVFSTYNIEMTPETTINQSQDLDRISLVYGPTMFYNIILKNFTFLISSPFGDLLSYGFNLSYPGGSIAFDGSLAGGEINKQEYTIIGASVSDVATLFYYYETGLAGHRNFTKYYSIIVEGSNQTMIGVMDNTYGLGLFERLLIAVLGAIMIVGIATLIGRLIPGMALGMFWLGFMVYIGFIPLWSVLITITISLILIGIRSEG